MNRSRRKCRNYRSSSRKRIKIETFF
uniref:Uncharacterized protein n=1 Tax=Anguilla anguilla TaxID=7936 RepID=A0A0E9RLH9_ANGAN